MDKKLSIYSRIKDKILSIIYRLKGKTETRISEDLKHLIVREKELEENSSEKKKIAPSIGEDIKQLIDREKKLEESRAAILNTIYEGITGLEEEYDKRLEGLERSREAILNKLLNGITGLEEEYDKRFKGLEVSIGELRKEKEERGVFGFTEESLKNIRDLTETIGSTQESGIEANSEFVSKLSKEDSRAILAAITGAIPKNDAMKILEFMKKSTKDDLEKILTLTKVAPHELSKITRDLYLFNWDNVPGSDNNGFLRFLRDHFNIDWVVENVEIRKSTDGKTISISKDENFAEIIIDEKKEKGILKISDGRTYDLKVKTENGKLNIYALEISKALEEKIGVSESILDEISEDKLRKIKLMTGIATLLSEDDTELIKTPPQLAENYPLTEILERVIGDASESKERVKKLIKIPLLYAEGIALLKEGEEWAHREACKRFDEILWINPNLKGAWLNKGFALGELGKIADEIICYKEALYVDKSYKKALRNMKIAEKETKYLFGMVEKVEGIINNLNDSIIPEGLKDMFTSPLSESATITKKYDKLGIWELNDKEKIYIIRKEDGKLNIYKQKEKNASW
jgi:tetratricopeptide (TPR) repeat protein